uniref:Endoplasmic reticulum vesicle transporter C-terminal domain-containing protein n=1 Tax=Bicosoecida sp. CB-2014 TaxID=1486930 RepID=A0A7S1CC96_9STRA|mmetsp:Transcript_19359/g.68505  ORF Transcript_19359/g.68505 Transcript_19359/m.68505 type:complete len:300 (+) Transcript_19359:408-1307(+)
MKAFDLHVKVAHEHLVKRTLCGAVLTAAFAALSVALVVNEASLWATTEVEDHLRVDAGVSMPLDVALNIAFPHVRCRDLRVTVSDARGLTYAELRVNLEKTPFPDADKGDQAPGCVVAGTATVRKVAGLINIEAGAAAQIPGFRRDGDTAALNTSHVIRKLSFGDPFPGMVEALGGFTSPPRDKPARYQYFIQAVPTVYEPLRGARIASHQYSATKFVTDVEAPDANDFEAIMMGGGVQPAGVYFKFEFSPVMVRVVETKRTVLQFLTSICAIVGGVFTVAGMVDATAHRTSEFVKKQA